MPIDPAATLDGTDLVLLMLAAPTKVGTARDRITGITRLEKLLFLADKEEGISERVEDPFLFKPYHYGPYSKEVYEAVEVLEEAELMAEERAIADRSIDEAEEFTDADREGVERRFMLTPRGKAVAGLLAQRHPDVMKKLAAIKDRYAGLSLRALLRLVYREHPEYAQQSKIRDEIL